MEGRVGPVARGTSVMARAVYARAAQRGCCVQPRTSAVCAAACRESVAVRPFFHYLCTCSPRLPAPSRVAAAGHTFATRMTNVFVIGKGDKPMISLPKGKGIRQTILQEQAELLNPYPRPRGFVYKARTREEYEQWRKSQSNPRLW